MSPVPARPAFAALALVALVSGCRRSRATAGPDATTPPATSAAPGIPAVDVALADAHGCLRDPSGVVKCWGRSVAGEVGDGTEIPDTPFSNVRTAPTKVTGVVGAGTLHVSDGLSWVVHPDHGVTAWGSVALFASDGKLPVHWKSLVPKKLDVPPVTALAVGSGAICGLAPDGRVLCAGPAGFGEAGDSAADGSWAGHADFRPVRSVPHAEAIVTLGRDTCALEREAVFCWGISWGKDEGEAPHAHDVPRAVPGAGARPGPAGAHAPHAPHPTGHAHVITRRVAALPIARATGLFVGLHEMCAVDAEGAAWCWPAGASSLPTNPAPARRAFGGAKVVELALGLDVCASTREGTVVCEDRYGPIDTARLRGATQLAAAPVGVCGRVGAELRCAGRGGATEKELYASP